MKEPSPRASRLAMAAGIVALGVVGGGGFLLGQRSAPDRPVPVSPVVTVKDATPAPITSPSGILARADLLALAAEAADATARGDGMPAAVRDAVGKSFAIALPFGCDGPADAGSDAGMRWRYDEAAGALRINVTPVTWSPGDWWTTDGPSDAETIEGFWIPRPWTRSEACPAARASTTPEGAAPVTLAGQTLAIGQAFGADGTRQGRRDGKAYASVLRMALDEVNWSKGLALRLTGRLASGPNGGPATCRQPGGAEQRPVCLILISLEEVAIADPTMDTVLVTWPTGSPRNEGAPRPAR